MNDVYEFIEDNWNNLEVIIEKYKDIPEKDLGDYEKGVFYFKGILGFMEDFNKAEEHFSKVLSLESNNQYIFNVLGLLYYNQGKYDKAEEYYLKALEINPAYGSVLNNLGPIYKRQNKYEKAEEYYLKALEIEPESPLVLNNLGVLYCEKLEYEKALKYIKKIIEIDPTYNTPTILHNLKVICFETNRNMPQVLIETIIELKSTFQAENNKLNDELEEYALHEAYKPDSIIARKIKEHYEEINKSLF